MDVLTLLTWAQGALSVLAIVLVWIITRAFRGGQFSSELLERLAHVEARTGTDKNAGSLERRIDICDQNRLAIAANAIQLADHDRRLDIAGEEMSKIASHLQGVETRIRREYQPLDVAAVLTRENQNRFAHIEKDIENLYKFARGTGRGRLDDGNS